MRKTIQFVLCLCAIAALAVTGVSFYRIVLASTIHGAPVRFIEATAGPYHLKLALYNDPINAGDAIPFNIAVAPGTRGPLTYQVTASPGPDLPAGSSLAQGDVNTQQNTPYGVQGSITLVTRGSWTLNVVINGPAGQGKVAIPLTAVALPAIPTWLAWSIGLLPVYGLLIFWVIQTRHVAQKRPGDGPAERLVVTGVMKEVA